jgi:hypothetical protein
MRCAFAYVISSYPDPDNPLGPKKRDAKGRNTPELQQVVVLDSSVWHHDNGCFPSYEQYRYQAKKAGTLLSKASQKMDDLLNILHLSDFRMNNKTLRAHLKLVNPSRSFITADELRNFRLWARIQIRKRQNCNENETAKLITDKVLKEMFSDMIAKPGSGESVAVEEANTIFHELLRDTMNDNNNSWQVENYLESLKLKDDTFDYFVGRDDATGAASIVVWQTGCMRADFELYGSAIHVDFMARKLNSYDWPYLSLAVIDANSSPRQFGEGIACTERIDAYIAAIKGLLRTTPGVCPKRIDALFADGIMGPSITSPENLNLPHTHFIWTFDSPGMHVK